MKKRYNYALWMVVIFSLSGFNVIHEYEYSSNSILDEVELQSVDEKSKTLIEAMEKVNGGWKKLAAKRDVQFTYVYEDKGKGTDISIERYIFNGEISQGEYLQHEVNVLPKTAGKAKQLLLEGQPSLTLDGNRIDDTAALGATQFLRRANFFWFAMMYKLNNPGIHARYMGNERIGGVRYDKVSITYDGDITGKQTNDEFILYFNPKTHLVDQFYFSLPVIGVNKPVLRMELEYEKVDGILLSTKRRGIYPDENGNYQLGGIYTIKNISFNNGFTIGDLEL